MFGVEFPPSTRTKEIPALEVHMGQVIVRDEVGFFRVWEVRYTPSERRVRFTVETIPGGTLTTWGVQADAAVTVLA